MKTRIYLTLCCLLLAGCANGSSQPDHGSPTITPMLTPDVPTPAPTIETLPNPASVYCEQQGYKTEIITAADGSQGGLCIFPDGSQCDEWAYYRGECGPTSQSNSTLTPPVAPTPLASPEIPTPLTINPDDYQGWWTYSESVHGFSLRLPSDWVIDETTTGDPLMNGHLLMLRPQHGEENISIRMTYRSLGEGVLLWPTGVGSGEFIPQGTLDVAGQPAQRILFVCPTGEVNAVWYHGGENVANIQRGNLEFGFIFSYNPEVYCQSGYSLSGKVQYVGDMIIASLQVP